MKNFQKLVLGLIIGVMAIGFSAFTNAPKKSNYATYYYGYSLSLDKYIQISGTPDNSKCSPDGNRCVVQSTTVNLPELTIAQAAPLTQTPGSSDDSHYFN